MHDRSNKTFEELTDLKMVPPFQKRRSRLPSIMNIVCKASDGTSHRKASK
jgi:hypothetical protein